MTLPAKHHLPQPLASSEAEAYPSWRAMTWFGLYRLVLATGLGLLLFVPSLADLIGDFHPTLLTLAVVFAYLGLALLGLALTHQRQSGKATLIQTGVFIDILVFSLLMHQGGGVNSHFGLALAIAVAAGALLMEGRLSLLFASFATTGVMAVQIHAQLSGIGPKDGFTQAGLLGATYFIVAILAHVLYRRIQAVERLAASRQVDIDDLSKLNAFIIQRIGTGVLVLDEARRIRLGNQATAELLNTQDLLGQPLARVAPELATWLARQATAKDPPPPTEAPFQPGGDTLRVGERDIEASHLWLGHDPQGPLLLFLRDKHALLQEAQQIKLAALGRLTASIAHNIRNPLSAINHAGQLLAESPDLEEEDQHLLGIVIRNSGRIDGIVESILQLSRGQPPEFQILDLGLWLRELHTELLESRRLPIERFMLDIAADTPPAKVNAGHLHQIIANLCDNAIKHAGTAERPPILRLIARRLADTASAAIEINDDGDPIDPGIAREMFTPFFTTSASGTGLGLYIALELAAINGIAMEYQATPGGGNSFCLRLPPAT
jgi:two-component system, NtrC family, sensor histidine kinase PilS